MKPPVRTKKDFVQRYAKGEFGNASPTWEDVTDWIPDWYWSNRYHIRNRIKGGKTWYDLPVIKVRTIWREAELQYGRKNLYISEMAPTEKTLIQGEVQRGYWGLDLYYTTVKKPMRDALAEWSCSVSGLKAEVILHDYLCPNSHEWLGILLDEYPEHVVEFSTYATNWGTLPNFNTVFWEVRNY